MISEKEKMIFAFVNKKFRDYIARHKKKKKSSATITRSQKMGDQSSTPKNILWGHGRAKVATNMGQYWGKDVFTFFKKRTVYINA